MIYVMIVAIVLFVVVMGYLDARVGWPGPTEKIDRYVSITERSTTLKRD
ncbi:MAG: hypothetical protein ABI670_17545 [Chloroflexota bacterium]